jgi:hypothetical protein
LLTGEVLLKDTIAKQTDTIEKLKVLVAVFAVALGNRDETIKSLTEVCQNLLSQNQLINVPLTLLSAYRGLADDLSFAIFYVNPEKGPNLVEYYFNRQRPLIQMAKEQLEACRTRLEKSA